MDEAKVSQRILAFCIDLIFLILITNVVQNLAYVDQLKFNFSEIGRFDLSLNFAPAAIWFIYFFLSDLLIKASLGKIILGLSLVNSNKGKANYKQILTRNLIKSFISPVLLIGFLMVFMNNERLALHDQVSNTKIVSK